MEITRENRLSDLVNQQPWLKDELSQVNDKFKMLNRCTCLSNAVSTILSTQSTQQHCNLIPVEIG